ncbi:MAG: rod shape-determining protein MreD [Gammaproteobacteria bacterium]|jgi:rod shape-determining protein MreD|nr:rod shape-determining protein MreD [Gammaproteobacteria bacterium]MBT5203777.1 rod shape-determining protein MreD [Gammaproteobacteria bacterium]MBT5600619.1 rod shape-determining protein MreD [Gammaproteobacteria bacterium]MBT6245123.1 rod shape-determining protein MreD [Gammaproteobacteria bacterium]
MAVNVTSRGNWVIAITLLLALILAILPLPSGIPAELGYLRPDWLALVIIYWTLALPDRIGLLTAFATGLIADLVLGSLFGLHALSLVIASSFTSASYQQVRMLAVWQQAILVAVMLSLVQLAVLVVILLLSQGSFSWLSFLIPLVSGLVWPWVFLGLRWLRRRFIN